MNAKNALVLILLCLGYAPAAFPQRIVEIPSADKQVAVTYQEIPIFSLETIRSEIERRVNEARKSAGLDALKADSSLHRLSGAHSSDMADSGYFGHIDLRGQDATQRAHRSGYLCVGNLAHPVTKGLGENLFTGFLYESYRLVSQDRQIIAEFDWVSESGIARRVVEGWLNSPAHRRNILEPAYRLQGIGIVTTDAYEIFVTQTLC